MKILSILGSPRKGNSEILLNEAIKLCKERNAEITILKPSELNISGCSECDACSTTGQCIIEDDMQKIYPLLKESDRIIIATPIFFFGIPAQFKLLIDRCQCLWYEKYVLKKAVLEVQSRKALLMIVGGMKKGEIGVTCAEATLKAFLRTIDVKKHSTLHYLGYDEAGAILRHEGIFEDIKKAVEELIKND